MRIGRPSSAHGRLIATPAALWAFSACAPDAPSSPGATTGSIRVEVVTSGIDAPAGYQVRVDDGEARGVASTGGVTFQGLTPGTRSVELISVPLNCSVAGPNPRNVVVGEGATSGVGFSVSCEAMPRGNLAVTTVTSGEDLDPDGYDLVVDGSSRGAIGIDDTRVVEDLPPGGSEVGLDGLADNCVIQGENPRTVPIFDGQTTPTTFAVTCVTTTGSIEVTVSTSGILQDANGYTVDLDGVETRDIGLNGRVAFTGVEEGFHTVTLGDVASNCRVNGDNPVTVGVTAGEVADVGFAVQCALF